MINVASFVALVGAATSQISYTASKGAVLSLSRELGVQFARRGRARERTRQFKYADRMGMLLAVVLGPEEQARGEVAVKELASGEQTTIRQEQAAAFIRELLLRRKAI